MPYFSTRLTLNQPRSKNNCLLLGRCHSLPKCFTSAYASGLRLLYVILSEGRLRPPHSAGQATGVEESALPCIRVSVNPAHFFAWRVFLLNKKSRLMGL